MLRLSHVQNRLGRFYLAAVITVITVGTLGAEIACAQQTDDPANQAIALFNKGQEAHEKGEIATALALYDKALAILPEFPEAELQRGNAILSLGRTADAEKAFRRALELRPDWTLAMASLGSVLVEENKFDEAEKLLSRAIDLDGQNFPAFSALVDLRLRTKAGPEALRAVLYRVMDLTAKSKPPASIWASQAALEDSLGRVEAAKLSAERALALDSSSRLAVLVLFNAALSEGDQVKAAALIGRYEKASGDRSRLLEMRARVLVAEGKPVEALALLNSAPNLSEEAAALRDRISASTATSAADLEKRLEANPKNADVLGRLCSMLRTENPQKALDYCRRASEAEPGNIANAVGYGAALVQAKRYPESIALFRRILLVAPENSAVHANLATAYFQLNQFAEAKPEYLWLTEKQPENAASYFFLAVTYDRLGEFLDAMANYQQFLKLADPKRFALEIDKVKLRIPSLETEIREGRGRKSNAGS